MTRVVYLDFETRSRADIKLLGGLNYVAHPTTDVLTLCASDGARRWCWSPFGLPDRRALGAEVSVSTEPWEIVAATEGARVVAHNAEGFDRPVWEALGLPEREWVDSLPLARRAQLPGKLESLAAYVLGEGKAEAGRKVTLSLSKPIALSAAAIDLAVQAAHSYLAGHLLPTGARQLQLLGVWPPSDEALRSLIASPPYGAEVLPTPSPAQLTEVIRYCMQDVELLRRICEAERLLEPHVDDDALEADRRVNHRGVAVDLALVDRLLTEADAQKARAGARVHAVTGGALGEADLRRPARLRAWFAEQGVHVEDCKGPTLFPLLKHADPAVVAVAQARRDVARVVTGKLKAAKLLVSADARLRGSHVYCKAHTWRWASRGVQTQNLPSAPDNLPPDLADRVLAGEPLDNADWLGALVRQCFYSPVGLCVVDFAQVEGRATCFLAVDEPGLEVFTSGKDPYCVEASAIFGEPIKKGDKRRQAGKVSVLACGFGGGPGAVERMARNKSIDLGSAGASAAQIVEAWRTAHPAIAGERTGREWTDETGALRFRRRGGAWKACERAFREAFAGPPQSLGFADFERLRDDVYVHLPSGRFLRYRDVEVGPFLDRDDTISYYSAEKNKRIPTHAGKLYQNVVQAYCRDLFADAFVRLEVAGYRVVLHEHDAWVIEAPESELPAILAIVRERPTWAADFPLDASGSWARRYAK